MRVVGGGGRGGLRRLAGAGARRGAGERARAGRRSRAGARDRARLGLPDGEGQGRRAGPAARRRRRPCRGGARRPRPGGRDPGRRERRLGRRHRRRAHPRAGPGGPGVRRAAVRVARGAGRAAPAGRRAGRRRRGGPPLGRPAARGPARGVRRRRPQGAAARRGPGGAGGGRSARPAVRGLLGAGVLGRHRRRGGTGRRAARAAVRLRAGHRGAPRRRRHQRPPAAGGRRPPGADRDARPAGRGRRGPGGRGTLARPTGRGTRVNPSTALARVLVDELVRGGVTDAVVAPGSRSAPVALALADAERDGRLTLHVRIDERTAAFLALGLAKASGRPVPVLTTSGTATAHLHAAVLEADAAGVPLLALTADRPPELRDTGANQTIAQPGLYGGAVRAAVDVGVPEAGREEAQNRYWRSLVAKALLTARGALSGDPGPVHFNLPFREPLLPEDADVQTAGPSWGGRRCPGRGRRCWPTPPSGWRRWGSPRAGPTRAARRRGWADSRHPAGPRRPPTRRGAPPGARPRPGWGRRSTACSTRCPR